MSLEGFLIDSVMSRLKGGGRVSNTFLLEQNILYVQMEKVVLEHIHRRLKESNQLDQKEIK